MSSNQVTCHFLIEDFDRLYKCIVYCLLLEAETHKPRCVNITPGHCLYTLSHVTQPYLRVKSAATYQLHNCYNLSVTCHHRYMLATVTSNNIFSGKDIFSIYGQRLF